MRTIRARLVRLCSAGQSDRNVCERRNIRRLAELQGNFRYASRMLWKQKTLSLIVIGLLAFAIGVNTAIFSVYNFLNLRSLPFPDSERLVFINFMGGQEDYASQFLQQQNQSFEALGIYTGDARNYSREGVAHPVNILVVSSDLASVFQYKPVLGRNFIKNEEDSSEPKVVMLSYLFWQREFGGSASALGQTLKLDGEVHTVIGVLPSNADFPQAVDLWVLYPKGRMNLQWAFGRHKEGFSLKEVRQELDHIHNNIMRIKNNPAHKQDPPQLQSFQWFLLGNINRSILVLLFSAGILLLIVCLNVAGMMLARSESRAQEIGIRTALGASRAGIIRQFLTESLLLSVPGVLLGLLLGQWFVQLIVFNRETALNTHMPSWVRLTPDLVLLTFCVVLTGITTILFGLIPALHASRVDVQQCLHDSGARFSAGRSKRTVLKMLMVGEIAFAVVLLVAAGLLLRVWQKTLAVDPGFRAERVFTFQLRLPVSYFRSGFFERTIDSLRQMPGVTAVSGSNILPMVFSNKYYFEAEGVSGSQADSMISMGMIFPDYFKTLEIPLMAGRDFSQEEVRNPQANVAIVDQSFARRYWPGADPIGKRVRIRDEDDSQGRWRRTVGLDQWMTVIGVTRDVSNLGLDKPVEPGVYYPYKKWESNWYYVLVRSNLDPDGTLRSIQSQLHKLDPDVAMFSPRAMTDIVKRSTYGRQFVSIIMAIFALAALLIAAAGVYGIVSYTVSRRTHEIGIRIALGATRTRILAMVMGGVARLVMAGAAFGLAGSIVASQALRGLLFGIAPYDLPSYLVTGAALVAVIAAATLVPAKRAASIEPIHSLRSE